VIPSSGGYYSALGPFEEMFRTGVPILTYHKIGPRPRGVRLKGLYLSPKLFERQLTELREAGFTSAPLESAANQTDNSARHVVLTFDDGYLNVVENALDLLAKQRFRAVQFLVVNFLGKINEWDLRAGEKPELLMDDAQVRDWLAAGHEIGSHTLTHPRLSRLTLRDAKEEITASKKRLEDLLGRPIAHFCYPYGDWNEPVRDLVVEAGYLTACTTRFGVNTRATSTFTLNRFTARYPTRNWRALKKHLAQWKLSRPVHIDN
jgi:peptidoglycan/xylan/chitin deacetylase (PgdA/CDA1 family)